MIRISALGLLLFVLAASGHAADDDLRSAVTRMAKIGSAWSPSFSPDGQEVAYVSDMTGTPQVWRVSSEGGFPRLVTSLDDTVSAVSWSPDGAWLAVAAAPGGGMNGQIYLVSPDGMRVERITPGDQASNWLGPWSDDGAALGLSSNRDDPRAMSPWVHELVRDASRKITTVEGISRIASFHPDGASILLGRVAGRGDNDLYRVSLDGEEQELITPHEPPGQFGGEFSKDGRWLYVVHNDGRDRMVLGRRSLEDSAMGALETVAERDDAELEAFALSDAGDRIALVWNASGRSELEVLELSSGERSRLSLPIDLVGSVEFSADGSRLVMRGRSAAAPSDIYLVELEDGAVRQLTSSPHPGVDLDALVRPELVTFASHDGLELSGWLYRPPGVEAPAPYVLSFHGGPEGQERPTGRSVYQALLAQGIGVFAPNIRGSSGFGKRYVNLDNRELRFDANLDIEACAEFLVEQGIADEDRLGIMGGSYGGYAVMVAVTEFPELFAAAVNLFGMVNFETFFAQTEPWMAAISGTEYGDPVTQQELLRELSPIHKLDQAVTPLMVQHGANDTNVPVVEAEQVVASLAARGIPHEYVLFEDEGHGFRKEPNRITSQVKTVEWFVEYLK
ncbi:MAG: S9 family peptidase [Pseudomonadales bacterium]|jgi:dipeptidyl aminopeptidase/acylaminoacyl peptidase|nr:S9 family peptidase [Pseudomonadales bacterium]